MEERIKQMIYGDSMISGPQRERLVQEIGHGIIVSYLAEGLARELGEEEDFCNNIAVAGLLHDVGKLWLNEYLYAEGEDKLVIERMRYMRMHPLHSYNALCREGYSEEIAKAVYSHHENYDGSGYPDCIKGENIPWMARILRTCDVFAALISNRAYRSAFDQHSAIEIMIDEVANYDMKVFLAFQRLLHTDWFDALDLHNLKLTPLQEKHLSVFFREAKQVERE